MKLRTIPKYICEFIYASLWAFALGFAANIGFARNIWDIVFDLFLSACLMFCVISMHMFLEKYS